LREIIQDKERRDFILKKVAPVGKEILSCMNKAIQEETDKGTIRPVKAQDLLMNIASLNVFAFVAVQIFFDGKEEPNYEQFLEGRKQNNVDIIINSLKIK
jgi:hypothetical protein